MKKLLLLIVACAVSATSVSAAAKPDEAKPADDKSLFAKIREHKLTGAGVWAAGLALGYHLAGIKTGVGPAFFDAVCSVTRVKVALDWMQDRTPAMVKENPEVSAAIIAIAVTYATHRWAGVERPFILGAEALGVYAIAHYLLTHEIDPTTSAADSDSVDAAVAA